MLTKKKSNSIILSVYNIILLHICLHLPKLCQILGYKNLHNDDLSANSQRDETPLTGS